MGQILEHQITSENNNTLLRKMEIEELWHWLMGRKSKMVKTYYGKDVLSEENITSQIKQVTQEKWQEISVLISAQLLYLLERRQMELETNRSLITANGI